MVTSLCSVLHTIAIRRWPLRARELPLLAFVESPEFAAFGSVSTLAVALVSAVALAAFGGA